MVMVGESCFEGRGFESQYCILVGHFSHIFVVKVKKRLFEKTKINKKRPGMADLKNQIEVGNNECSLFESMMVYLSDNSSTASGGSSGGWYDRK